MVSSISKIINDISKIDQQRQAWLKFSIVVFIGVIGYIVFWNKIHDLNIPVVEWILISAGLSVSVIWWYWTMGIVRKTLTHQTDVVIILDEIVQTLKIIKEDVKDLNNPVDKK